MLTEVAQPRPLVSVIIPNYNHGRYVGAAIESVLRQTYDRVEVIVVDNFSTDASWDVIIGYAKDGVRAFRFANEGVVAAVRNHGIEKATGELIAFLDADDTWKPHKLERQIVQFADPSVQLVATAATIVGDVARARRDRYFRTTQPYRDFNYDEIVLENPVATTSVVMRADTLRQLDGFDESRNFRFIEDWELWLRVSRVGRVRVLAEPLINYRLDVNKARDTRDVTQRKLLVLEKHRRLEYLGDDVYQQAEGNVLVELGRACLGIGDWAGFRYYVRGMVKSGGVRRKLTAIVGLVLFALPRRARLVVIDLLYRVQHAVGECSR